MYRVHVMGTTFTLPSQESTTPEDRADALVEQARERDLIPFDPREYPLSDGLLEEMLQEVDDTGVLVFFKQIDLRSGAQEAFEARRQGILGGGEEEDTE